MSNKCIIVADRARARFITFEPASEDGARSAALVEHEDWVNPEGELTGKELFSNERGGPAPSPGGGPAHNYDDHREDHLREIGRRFAQRLAGKAIETARAQGAQQVILMVEPHMLGLLRKELESVDTRGLEIHEIPGEYSWHSLAHIDAVLHRQGLLPAGQLATNVYRPRAQPTPHRH